MGSLSEYINGYRGRHSVFNYDSPRFNTRTGSLNAGTDNGYVTVEGIDVTDGMLGRMMTNDPILVAYMTKKIREVLKEARKKLSQDARNYMKSDPRKAARAVKFAVYKSVFGGNLSILQKRKGTGVQYQWVGGNRKVDQNPNMWGGNRVKRSDDSRNRLDLYFGADRGFALRFISSGTVRRTSRLGNRGSMRQTNWFGNVAPWHMDEAAAQFAEAINEYINQQTNG